MNDQKDIQKTGVNSYGHKSMDKDKSLVNKHVYEFANKKTEKLVTALYMITDCMDSGDAIKGKLRSLGVDLLSDIHRLPILSPVEKHTCTTTILSRIEEILALVEIAYTIGFVSEMNGSILKKEFSLLTRELQSYQSENQNSSFGGVPFENQKSSSFMLTEKMFEVDQKSERIGNGNHQKIPLKDKRTDFHHMSFRGNGSSFLSSYKGLPQLPSNGLNKKDRSDKILTLIKEKKEVSIKDISISFADCSEKTIQRELNTLVEKGQVKKIGEKRWSRYQAIS